jgi:quercetin dioxygenase-like cupin family protein
VIRALAATLLLALPAARGAEPSPQAGGPVAILDNAAVNVVRRRLAAAAHETIRANGGPLLIVHPSRGPAFVQNGGEYAALNDEPAPIDLLIVAIKPNRPAAPAAPPTEAPPGITRVTLIDNADVRVVRVTFAPGSREPVHTHPNDLLTIQLTPGRFDILLGQDRSGASQAAGSVKFLPRNVQHAYISIDSAPFDLLSISIK